MKRFWVSGSSCYWAPHLNIQQNGQATMKTCKIRKQVWKCKQLFFLLGINFMPSDSQFIFYQENNWDPNIWCNIQVFCNTSSPDFSNFCLLQNPHNILLLSRALIFLMERDDVGGQMAERQRLICLKKKKNLSYIKDSLLKYQWIDSMVTTISFPLQQHYDFQTMVSLKSFIAKH